MHHELAEWYWEAGLGRCIVDAELGFLRALVGLDLHVQRYPYLRVACPGQAWDVTGIHRDTDYGASAYEVSMVVPFTRMGEEGALRVVSGSHLDPPERYPATRVESESVTPGSSRHLLGFPYAPQVLDDDVVQRAEPVAVEVGQALVMSLGLVHGQALNAGTTTRFSTDVRVVNSLAPVAFARGVHADYYVPLCESPVTEQARRHAGLPDLLNARPRPEPLDHAAKRHRRAPLELRPRHARRRRSGARDRARPADRHSSPARSRVPATHSTDVDQIAERRRDAGAAVHDRAAHRYRTVGGAHEELHDIVHRHEVAHDAAVRAAHTGPRARSRVDEAGHESRGSSSGPTMENARTVTIGKPPTRRERRP